MKMIPKQERMKVKYQPKKKGKGIFFINQSHTKVIYILLNVTYIFLPVVFKAMNIFTHYKKCMLLISLTFFSFFSFLGVKPKASL